MRRKANAPRCRERALHVCRVRRAAGRPQGRSLGRSLAAAPSRAHGQNAMEHGLTASLVTPTLVIAATLAAPPGMELSRSKSTTGTGASGEIRETRPQINWSSMISPTTTTRARPAAAPVRHRAIVMRAPLASSRRRAQRRCRPFPARSRQPRLHRYRTVLPCLLPGLIVLPAMRAAPQRLALAAVFSPSIMRVICHCCRIDRILLTNQ